MTLDSISEERLRSVHPQLADKIRTLGTMLAAEGITFRVTQGLRSYMDQQRLYAQGRTEPGPVVTNAQGGHSWHNFGLAVDVVPMGNGKPEWDAIADWNRIITVGVSLGLVSGKSWKDEPHFQMTGKFGVSPDDEVRSIFIHGGVLSVWDEVFANSEQEKP